MKKILLIAGILSCMACQAMAQIAPLSRHELFVTTDSSAYPYRIPAIAQVTKGALVAVGDYRYCGQDIGFGRVDLQCTRSLNNGATWSKPVTILQGSGVPHAADCGYGDAAIVASANGKDMLLLCVTGNTVYNAATTTRQNPNRVARAYSHDGGKTWSAPQDITEQIYSLFDRSALGPVQSLFVGSGRICRSNIIKTGKYYRLYAALCARPGGNRVIYSDDFGQTWHALGNVDISPAPKGDEDKCAELPDGSVVLSSRVWGGRYFNIFRYTDRRTAAGEWGKVAFSGEDNHGTVAKGNATNGGILILPARSIKGNYACYVALQTVPLGPGRTNVGVYYKELATPLDYRDPQVFAANWQGPVQLTNKASAYSEIELQKDGHIAVFLEEVTHGAAYTLVYLQYSLEQLTQGHYRLSAKGKKRK